MPNTERIQCILNWKYFGERDALEVRKDLLDNGWTERDAVKEAYIALGEKLDKGWRPETTPDPVELDAALMSTITNLMDVAEMLSTMDIGKLRQIEGFNEETYSTLKTSGIKKGAARLISEETQFDEEDW